MKTARRTLNRIAAIPLLEALVATAAPAGATAAPAGATAAPAGATAAPAGATASPAGATVNQNTSRGSGVPGSAPSQTFGVGEIVVTYTDWSRRVFVSHHGWVPRQLVTLIRYPAAIAGSHVDALAAPPVKRQGRFPLIVFAHGFNITPAPYASLLRAWVRAGYVVAAPIFPLSNAAAPGGADEADLVNQPTDMSFVISRILAADGARHGILSGLIDGRRIAVAGQSDGGSTALAVAYNRNYVDHRIRAAMILSGAKIPGLDGYSFPRPSPPLLAVQGTADVINLAASTEDFFRPAPQPKFLLSLLGAPHLGPYTNEQPQLAIAERVTIAFLDRYLKQVAGAASRMQKAGNVPRLASLTR